VKLFFSAFLQNTNLYNLTASLCIALLLKMVSRDEILRDTRTWFGQPPATNEQVPRGQTKQPAETCAVFVKSLLKQSLLVTQNLIARISVQARGGEGGGGGTGKKSPLSLIIGKY